jgi:heme exporter protein D
MTPLPPIRGATQGGVKTHHIARSGFRGERALVFCSLALGIISTVLLIELTIMQRKHTKMELEEKDRKAKEAEEAKNKKV